MGGSEYLSILLFVLILVALRLFLGTTHLALTTLLQLRVVVDGAVR